MLSKVLDNFGFSSKESQLALLNIFHCAGYLSDHNIWLVLNMMDFDGDEKNKKSSWRAGEVETFFVLKRVLDKASANHNDHKFDAEYFLENAFSDEEVFDMQDVQDFVLYLGQSAFGRNYGQERSDLVESDWMKIYEKEYLRNAEILGFIKEKKPHHQKYEESWIQGGARLRMISRINYLKKIQDQKIDCGLVRILTGDRELSVEIDKIQDDENEVKNFICDLAKENKLEFNQENPFIKKRFGQYEKTCLNVVGNQVVTETMMARHIYRKVFGCEIDNVVDSKAVKKIGRPTTQKNAHDIIDGDLFGRINHGDFADLEAIKIMIISNQPYCNRQVGTIMRTALEVMEKKRMTGQLLKKPRLIFDGVGEQFQSTVVQIHSVLGALISEDFLITIANDNKRKRETKNLMFASRRNDVIVSN